MAETNLTFDGSILKVTGDTLTLGDEFVRSANVSDLGSGNGQEILSIPTTSGNSATFDYYVSNGSDFRGGTVLVAWNGSTTAFTDYSADSGDTTGFSWTATISGGNVQLQANIASGSWTVKVGSRIVF